MVTNVFRVDPSVGQSSTAIAFVAVLEGDRFNPHRSPFFFRLLGFFFEIRRTKSERDVTVSRIHY